MRTMMERLTDATNSHDAAGLAALFADDYLSAQPVHPGRAFGGRAQVLANWTAVFEGVPNIRAELLDQCSDGETEWGELDWHGEYADGSPFGMRGVIIATVHDGLVAKARLYMEPVDRGEGDIDAAVEELYKPPANRPS